MIRRNPLKLLFYLCLAIVVALVGYKVYLNFFKQDFETDKNSKKSHRNN